MPGAAKTDQLTQHSDLVKDVLGRVPNWITKWGITVFFFFIVSLLVLSWIVRYPDVLPARIVITTPAPPSSVVAQASGKLVKIMARDNQQVKKGEVLAVLENSANADDVLRLAGLVDLLSTANMKEIARQHFPERLQLGEVQRDYAEFLKNYHQYKFYASTDALQRETGTIRMQQSQYSQLMAKQKTQKDIYEQEIVLAENDFARTQRLLNERAISMQEYEDRERALLQLKRAYEVLQANIITTQITLSDLDRALTGLSLQNDEKNTQYALALAGSFKNVLGSLSNWQQRYVLRAPISGKVSFFKFWAANQFVSAGNEVMVVVPEEQQHVIGKLLMPVQNSGKVKPGQTVNIQLDNYPYQEYGMLSGTVKSISLVPRENMYAIEVKMPEHLVTTYHKKLVFRQEMQGSAEIITEDLRLLERIFYQLRYILTVRNPAVK